MEQNIAPPCVWAALRRPGIVQLVEDLPTGHTSHVTLELTVLEADDEAAEPPREAAAASR